LSDIEFKSGRNVIVKCTELKYNTLQTNAWGHKPSKTGHYGSWYTSETTDVKQQPDGVTGKVYPKLTEVEKNALLEIDLEKTVAKHGNPRKTVDFPYYTTKTTDVKPAQEIKRITSKGDTKAKSNETVDVQQHKNDIIVKRDVQPIAKQNANIVKESKPVSKQSQSSYTFMILIGIGLIVCILGAYVYVAYFDTTTENTSDDQAPIDVVNENGDPYSSSTMNTTPITPDSETIRSFDAHVMDKVDEATRIKETANSQESIDIDGLVDANKTVEEINSQENTA
jgi:hypothetical protein